MSSRSFLYTGIAGTFVVLVCRFTPALVLLLAGVGLSAWLGWMDFVLFPALFAFIALTVFAWMKYRRERETAG
jgi:mercuric ion transport protein